MERVIGREGGGRTSGHGAWRTGVSLATRLLCAGFLFTIGAAVSAEGGLSAYYSAQNVRRLASLYGFATPEVRDRMLTLRGAATTVVLEQDTRKLYFNGVLVWLHGGVNRVGNQWLLQEADIPVVLDPLLRPDRAVRGGDSRIVVLDPGHGGKDSGTVGRQASEKMIALDIARRVAERLRESQVTVCLTRTADSTVSLDDRCGDSARWNADAFVSIHCNSAADASVSGVETFVMTAAGCAGTASRRADARVYSGNRNDPANMVLGYYLQKGVLVCARGADRGIKRARFEVLRDSRCPAALVECGFLSNRREESMLMDPRYRESVAEGISRGLLTFLARIRNARPVVVASAAPPPQP